MVEKVFMVFSCAKDMVEKSLARISFNLNMVSHSTPVRLDNACPTHELVSSTAIWAAYSTLRHLGESDKYIPIPSF